MTPCRRPEGSRGEACGTRSSMAAGVTAAVRKRVPWQQLNIQAAFVLSYLAGVAASLVLAAYLEAALALAGAALCLVLMLMAFRRSWRALLLVTAGFTMLGLAAGSLRLMTLADSALTAFDGKRVTLEVTVVRAPRQRDGRISFIGEAHGGEYRGNILTLNEKLLVELYCGEGGDCPSGDISEGVRFRVPGSLRLTRASPGADFDYSQYMARRGVHVVFTASLADCTRLEPRGGLLGLVDTLRRHSRASLANGGHGAASGLLQGMVLGDVSEVPDATVDDMRDAGLLHLLAVSGQNVVLLGFVIMIVCRVLMISRRAAAIAAIATVCAYIPLTGADPSIMRAGTVGILGLVAMLFGRRAPRYYLLAISAAVLLTWNPNNLLEPGFQLSYAAVLAIFIVAPAISRLLGFLPELLAQAVAISAAAGLATAPITLAHFQQVSLVTIPANIAAAPVAGPVMFLGTLSILAAPISGGLCWLLNLVACSCTAYLAQVAGFFASLPAAVYVGTAPGVVAIVLFYAMLVTMTALIKRTSVHQLGGWLTRGRAWSLPVMLLMLIAVFACFGGTIAAPPDSYTVSFLDVGQGDATLIQVPGGATVLVDGGPGSTVLDRLKESGVERIDAVVLSHPHADHLDGLIAALEKYDVSTVYDAAAPTTSPIYADFLRLIERRHIPYEVVRRGDRVEFGELVLEVYSPDDEFVADDINANSVVLVAGYRGMEVLLPGDAEGDMLTRLGLPEVEVLKVSHHGSGDDYLERTLASVKPQVAAISVGAGNDYGHPAESTLSRLERAGARVFRTDRDGTVRVTLDGGALVVSTTN